MRKFLFVLCAVSLLYSLGCAEKAEKKEAPKPEAAAPAQTKAHVSGGGSESPAHVSGAPASPQPAAKGTEHVSGN